MTGSGSNAIDDLFLLKFGGFKEMRFKNIYKQLLHIFKQYNNINP